MTYEQLLTKYVNTGIPLPEYQVKNLPKRHLKSYLRVRIRAESELLKPYELDFLNDDEFDSYLTNFNTQRESFDDDIKELLNYSLNKSVDVLEKTIDKLLLRDDLLHPNNLETFMTFSIKTNKNKAKKVLDMFLSNYFKNYRMYQFDISNMKAALEFTEKLNLDNLELTINELQETNLINTNKHLFILLDYAMKISLDKAAEVLYKSLTEHRQLMYNQDESSVTDILNNHVVLALRKSGDTDYPYVYIMKVFLKLSRRQIKSFHDVISKSPPFSLGALEKVINEMLQYNRLNDVDNIEYIYIDNFIKYASKVSEELAKKVAHSLSRTKLIFLKPNTKYLINDTLRRLGISEID
jgi:hypothetical protein